MLTFKMPSFPQKLTWICGEPLSFADTSFCYILLSVYSDYSIVKLGCSSNISACPGKEKSVFFFSLPHDVMVWLHCETA